MEVINNTIVISSVDVHKWKEWASAFKEMAENGDYELIIPDVFEDENFSNWK